MVTQNLGIDISAEDFHVCLKVRRPDSSIKVKGQRKFKNNYSGFKQLKTWLEKKMLPGQPLHVTMEATGVYHQTLAYFLYECGYKIHILLPNRTKAYFRFLHLKSKTDKIDTLALAELGISHPLDDWQPPKPLLRQLKSLSRERLTLSKDRTVIQSRIHGGGQSQCNGNNRRCHKAGQWVPAQHSQAGNQGAQMVNPVSLEGGIARLTIGFRARHRRPPANHYAPAFPGSD